MVDLVTERSFWQVKAEYAGFAEFLADVSDREDHVRERGSRRQSITSYLAGTARVRLLEDNGALINVFRELRTLTDCVGTALVWGNGAELEAMKARYGGTWTDAVDSCYLDDKYTGLAWQPHWEEEETGWAQAWRYVWETAELDRAMMSAWTEQPELDPLELYEREWPAWWAGLPDLNAGGGGNGGEKTTIKP